MNRIFCCFLLMAGLAACQDTSKVVPMDKPTQAQAPMKAPSIVMPAAQAQDATCNSTQGLGALKDMLYERAMAQMVARAEAQERPEDANARARDRLADVQIEFSSFTTGNESTVHGLVCQAVMTYKVDQARWQDFVRYLLDQNMYVEALAPHLGFTFKDNILSAPIRYTLTPQSNGLLAADVANANDAVMFMQLLVDPSILKDEPRWYPSDEDTYLPTAVEEAVDAADREASEDMEPTDHLIQRDPTLLLDALYGGATATVTQEEGLPVALLVNPLATSSKVTMMNAGERVTIVSCSRKIERLDGQEGSWCKARYGAHIGWVFNTHLAVAG